MNPSVQAGETPRTDLAASKARFTGAVTDQWGNTTVAQGDFEYVTADFARQLERELTALQSERGAVVEMFAKACEEQIVPSHQAGGDAIEAANYAFQAAAGIIRSLAPKKQEPERGAVVALAELVRLEDLKSRIQHDAMEPRERDALVDEYERCMALAWEAARAITLGTRSSPLR